MPVVPSVVGNTLTDAVNIIGSAGLGVGSVSSGPSDLEKGLVAGVDPAAGTEVDAGLMVALVLSDGPPGEEMPPPQALFEVPDVVGARFEEAKAILLNAGFGVSVEQTFSADEDFGLVLSQQPPGHSFSPQPSDVAIVISKGSPPQPPGPPKPPDGPIFE
jgi:eukaryotic-like serine/threonine-protein kinase